MGKIRIGLLLLIFWLLNSIIANAEETRIRPDSPVVDLSLSLLGYASGALFHEAGHLTAAWLYGAKGIGWIPHCSLNSCPGFLTYRLPFTFTRDRKAMEAQIEKLRVQATVINLSGFAAEILSANVMLALDAVPKDNPFVIGWLVFNLVDPLVYVAANEFNRTRGGSGDLMILNGYETGWSYAVEVILLGHAVLSGYRLFSRTDFPIYSYINGGNIQLGWSMKF